MVKPLNRNPDNIPLFDGMEDYLGRTQTVILAEDHYLRLLHGDEETPQPIAEEFTYTRNPGNGLKEFSCSHLREGKAVWRGEYIDIGDNRIVRLCSHCDDRIGYRYVSGILFNAAQAMMERGVKMKSESIQEALARIRGEAGQAIEDFMKRREGAANDEC